MRWRDTHHPFAMTTVLFWALAYVLTRQTLQYFSPFSLGFLRYAAASAALILLCLCKRIPPPEMRDLPWFLASGAAGFAFYVTAFHLGAGNVTSATSSVVITIAPVLTALLASVLLREKLLPRQWMAIGLEFSGILVLTLYQGVFSVNFGVLWLLLAALLVSVYNLIQRRLTRRYSPIQSCAYSIFAGTLMLCVFAPPALVQAAQAPARQLVFVVLLGVFSSAVAYVTWSTALSRAEKTSLASNYMFCTPFLTALLGFALAGEVPESATWLGGACILSGAALFYYRKKDEV